MSGIGLGISPAFSSNSPSYKNKVLGIQPANLIAYWPLDELSGAVADNTEGTAARDGTYTGVTFGQPGIGDGNTCPLFDGANDLVAIYSDSLRDAFDKDKGTLAIWFKVSGPGVWTDGVWRYCAQLHADNSNYIVLAKTNTNNQFLFRYRAGGLNKQVQLIISDTGWNNAAITWDTAVDEVKAYINGAQTGATQSSLGAWAGNLTATGTRLGAATAGPTLIWDGPLAHVPVWTTPLVLADIQSVATV